MPVKPIPEKYHSVTPYLIVNDAAQALEFYQKALGATETMRVPGQNGKIMHAEIRIGDSAVMLADEFPDMNFLSPTSLGGSGFSLMLYVEDVDRTFHQALQAGATELMPIQDQFYGDRSGTLKDPFGHVWTVATHKEDLSPEELSQRTEEAMKNWCA